MKNFIERYNENEKNLKETDQIIYNYILQNIEEVKNLTIKELSSRVSVSQSSIVRFTQRLGLNGFSELKYLLKEHIEEIPDHRKNRLTEDSLFNHLNNTYKHYKHVDLTSIYKELYQSKRIFFYGTGLSQRNVLSELKRNLLNADKYSISLGGLSELEIVSRTITNGDILFVASLSGRVLEEKVFLQTIEARGGKIISITETTNNNLAILADYNLYFSTQEEYIGTSSLVSLLPAHLLVELLYRGYLNYINFDRNDSK